jgi:hypothetical protein
MTKRKPNAVRGQPRRDKNDQLVIDLAAAFRLAWQLGVQGASDLAIGLLEGQEVQATKRPRGRRPQDWRVVGFQNFAAEFRNRTDYLAKKSKRGLPPRADVVLALAAALQSGDEGALLGVLKKMLIPD